MYDGDVTLRAERGRISAVVAGARRRTVAGLRVARLYVEAYRSRGDEVNVLHYCYRNWGDAINPWLVEAISGRRVTSIDIDARSVFPSARRLNADPMYAVVGSILQHADGGTVVWGAGFEAAGLRPRQPPRAIHAVRGPLSAAELRASGISCGDTYGDPVLLMPRLYRPLGGKRYQLGVIPHLRDLDDPALRRFAARDDVRVIDLRGPLWATVNAVVACERVVSTSLHGLILADAYGIPNAWAALGGEIPGGTFKFLDYYASIARPEESPACHLASDSLDRLLAAATRHEVALDLDRLLEACPFRPASPDHAAQGATASFASGGADDLRQADPRKPKTRMSAA